MGAAVEEEHELAEGYLSKRDLKAAVSPKVMPRVESAEMHLIVHGSRWIELDPEPRIRFDRMTAADLADVMEPAQCLTVLFARRARLSNRDLKREIGFELTSYEPKLSRARLERLAGKLLENLPASETCSALLAIYQDRLFDSEERKHKGNSFEEIVWGALGPLTGTEIVTRARFPVPAAIAEYPGQRFEVDAPVTTDEGELLFGGDCKRIEGGLGDVRNRCREIREAAVHAKAAFPDCCWVVFLYVPHPQLHATVRQMLLSDNMDEIVFLSNDPEVAEREVRAVLEAYRPDLISRGASPAAADAEANSPRAVRNG